MDGDDWVFMDMETFDTETIPAKVIGDNSMWIKEVIRPAAPADSMIHHIISVGISCEKSIGK